MSLMLSCTSALGGVPIEFNYSGTSDFARERTTINTTHPGFTIVLVINDEGEITYDGSTVATFSDDPALITANADDIEVRITNVVGGTNSLTPTFSGGSAGTWAALTASGKTITASISSTTRNGVIYSCTFDLQWRVAGGAVALTQSFSFAIDAHLAYPTFADNIQFTRAFYSGGGYWQIVSDGRVEENIPIDTNIGTFALTAEETKYWSNLITAELTDVVETAGLTSTGNAYDAEWNLATYGSISIQFTTSASDDVWSGRLLINWQGSQVINHSFIFSRN